MARLSLFMSKCHIVRNLMSHQVKKYSDLMSETLP